jgi:hypothetical protein
MLRGRLGRVAAVLGLAVVPPGQADLRQSASGSTAGSSVVEQRHRLTGGR